MFIISKKDRTKLLTLIYPNGRIEQLSCLLTCRISWDVFKKMSMPHQAWPTTGYDITGLPLIQTRHQQLQHNIFSPVAQYDSYHQYVKHCCITRGQGRWYRQQQHPLARWDVGVAFCTDPHKIVGNWSSSMTARHGSQSTWNFHFAICRLWLQTISSAAVCQLSCCHGPSQLKTVSSGAHLSAPLESSARLQPDGLASFAALPCTISVQRQSVSSAIFCKLSCNPSTLVYSVVQFICCDRPAAKTSAEL